MENRGQLIIGGTIVAVGIFLLIGTVTGVNIWRFVWPLVLIGLGAWLILRPRMVAPGTSVDAKLLGDIKRSGAWTVKDEEIWLAIGDVKLNLTAATIPPGETKIRVGGFVAEVNLVVPDDVGVGVHSSAFLTTAKVLGEKRDVFLSPYKAESANYATAERRIRLETTFFVADLKVRQEAGVGD
jgi:lia operon protein LiaF